MVGVRDSRHIEDKSWDKESEWTVQNVIDSKDQVKFKVL